MCTPTPKRYALLVGIDVYLANESKTSSGPEALPLHNLRGCTNDVAAMDHFLKREYAFDDVSVLTSSLASSNDGQYTLTEPADHLPTFNNINSKFEDVYRKAAPGDFFFFHYSGHGARLARHKNSPRKNIELHGMSDPSLITVDFHRGGRPVRGWELNEWLKKINDKGIQVVATLDSCYSGSSWRSASDYTCFRTPKDWPSVPHLSADGRVISEHPRTMEPAFRGAKLETSWDINPEFFTLMAACGAEERAGEKVVDGKTYGAFTWELLDYLQHRGGRAEKMTYRMISDQLNIRLRDQNQSPKLPSYTYRYPTF